MHIADTSSDKDTAPPAPGAHAAMALLLLINLFNYIDRQVLSAVLARLQLDGTLFSPTDPNLQMKLGWLTSAFLISYMLFSPFVGWLDGHGFRRWYILGIGVSVWSIASGCSGFATSYWILLIMRCCVGIGEGAYGPVAPALLSDAYPLRHRGKILALFNMAIPVGSALGFVIGGQVSDAFNDWRPAFWVTFVGLLLGVFCFTRKELPRRSTVVEQADSPTYFATLRCLSQVRSFVLCCAGMTAITYVLGGVAAFATAYIFQREARFVLNEATLTRMAKPPEQERLLPVPEEVLAKLRPHADGQVRNYREFKQHISTSLDEGSREQYLSVMTIGAATEDSPKNGTIATIFGGIVVLGGLVATALGAWLGEQLRPKLSGAYFWVIGGGALAALPAFLAFLYLPLPWGWVALFLTVCGLFIHVGPGNTILANVVSPKMRATSFAINILVIHLLGDVISPPIIGAIADESSLQMGFLVTSAMIVVGALLWFAGAKYLEADTAKVGE